MEENIMNVLVYDNEEQIGIAAGNYMCGQVLAKPNSVLGLATGSTPLKPYGHMIKLYEAGAVDFSKVTTFNLDEYCKLDVNDVKYQEIVVVLRKTISTYCESCETNGFNNDLKRLCIQELQKHNLLSDSLDKSLVEVLYYEQKFS